MSIGFRDGESEFHTTTAHAPHAAALPELMRILTSLADPSSAENEYTLHWNRDPEEFDFHFLRNGDKAHARYLPISDRGREASEKQLVFTHVGTVGVVVAAFAERSISSYADRDTDEFEFNWRQPFPLTEYEEFRKAVTTK